jgi:Tol biopolymer transport system component
LRYDGYVKVLDFGLAKLIESLSIVQPSSDSEDPFSRDFHSDPGIMMGTPRYMSPEQIRGMRVDTRADIFSLGVILYEMVAGRTPFDGVTLGEVVAAILNHEPPPLEYYVREVPAEFTPIVCKALAKDREQRYQAAKHLLVELKDLKLELDLADKLKQTGQAAARNEAGELQPTVDDVMSKLQGSYLAPAADAHVELEPVGGAMPLGPKYYILRLTDDEFRLANNISILRKTLGENGQQFIETAPKRGYRFVALVKEVEGRNGQPDTEELGEADTSFGVTTRTSKTGSMASGVKRHKWGAMLASAILIMVGTSFLYFFFRSPLPPKVTASTQITRDGHPKVYTSFLSSNSSLVTDGSRLYFSEWVGERWVIAQVSSIGGEKVVIPASLPDAFIRDISPSRSELLVETNGALWALPVLDATPRRLGDVLCHAASWSSDGRQIVYANGSTLYLANSDGTESHKLVTMDGSPHWLRWAPDGSRLRFTLSDPKTGSDSLWEVAADGSNPHPLLPGWNQPSAECCGNWTADGRYFVFQSTHNRMTDIWAMREETGRFRRGNQEPVQLTFGPLNYYAPLPSRDGKKLFAVGELNRGELVRYDSKTQQWATYLPGLSAEHLDFSSDGEWMTYVTYPEGDLWRSKVDGKERRQLSFPPMRASLPQWSPDGKRIAFAATMPGKPWKTYLVSAEGGTPQQLMLEERTELDPGWSPDGKMLVFGDIDAKTIHLLNLSTRQVSNLPGSEGLFSPRWSPDGRYIVAIPFGSNNKLLLFDFTTQKWTELANRQAGWPHWSRDGKYVYFCSFGENDPALFRVRIGNRKLEQLAIVKDFRLAIGVWGSWPGWAPDDQPLMLRDIGIQDIYALEWQTP